MGPELADVDEVIDLVATTKPSELTASEKIYARVLADSEDGVSLLGFSLRLNTPFAKLLEAFCDYHELPVGSVYFVVGERLLVPMESPGQIGWTLEKGVMKIEAKPCEEQEVTDDEAANERDEEITKWKRKQKKERKRAMAASAEEQAQKSGIRNS